MLHPIKNQGKLPTFKCVLDFIYLQDTALLYSHLSSIGTAVSQDLLIDTEILF